MDFPLDRRRLLYINVRMGQRERVGSVVVIVTNVYSKPVAEVFGSSVFLKDFESSRITRRLQQNWIYLPASCRIRMDISKTRPAGLTRLTGLDMSR